MKKLEVCLSPELIHLHELEGKIVVIVDVLRASTTIATALANGVKSIKPFDSVDACRGMKDSGYLVAGERGGSIIEGFDLGNSPLSFFKEVHLGEKLALTTTNGTKCIKLSEAAHEIIIGGMVNLNAVANYVKSSDKDVLVLCAGWKGRPNAEDTLFAGALAMKLEGEYEQYSDSILLSKALYNQAKNNMLDYLKNADHIRRLKNLGIEKDIEFCLSLNQFNVVPKLVGEDLVL